MTSQRMQQRYTTDWPQIGERWQFTTNTLANTKVTEGTVTGCRVHLGISVTIELATENGPESINPCHPGLIDARRVPHVIEAKGEPAGIPDAAEFEASDPDA